jgi:Delta7-sterol 5-desaturase
MTPEVEKIYTWWFDVTSIFLRYFLIAGGAYLIFYIWKAKFSIEMKIQPRWPGRGIIKKEIMNSIYTLCIYCIVSYLIFASQKAGNTKIYVDIYEYGLLYFIGSVIAIVMIHDTYFYWTHRLLHIPFIYKKVHRIHHLSINPTPWTAFSFHPFEAIISVLFLPPLVFLIPLHPFALFAFLTYMNIINVMGHLGFETFSKKFMNSNLGKYHNTATNHDYHHQYSNYNYGLYFSVWDRIMGTYKRK